MFKNFISSLRNELNHPLPGKEAQLKMASDLRLHNILYQTVPANPVKSGVLILFFPYFKDIKLALIKRAEDQSVHSGQISLPGGKYESIDKTMQETALRETEEEIGVKSGQIQMIGKLTELYIPPSNFMVFPYLGYCNERPVFKPDPKEVASIIEVDIRDFFKADNRKTKLITIRNEFKISAPVFEIQGHIIWGATGMILSELIEVLKNTDIFRIH
jgi:8-oxo-dGTP pyrophosphatase MutT (NUDIX family)